MPLPVEGRQRCNLIQQDLRESGVVGLGSRRTADGDCAAAGSQSRLVYQVRGRAQKTGQRTSFKIGGHRRSRVAGMEPVLRAWNRKGAGSELGRVMPASGRAGRIDQDRRFVASVETNGVLPLKKTLHASEQEREDVQQARRAWQQALPMMEVEKLVFIDETWTSTA